MSGAVGRYHGRMDAKEATIKLGNAILTHVTPLLFVKGSEEDGYEVLNNATGGFVDTGTSKLLVTNAHVVQAFDEKLRTETTLKLVIGSAGKAFAVDRSWLKDHYKKPDLKLDLATFTLPEDFDISTFGKSFYLPASWPPERATPGDFIVIAGYPGDHRTQAGTSATMRTNVIADPVSTVNDVVFVLADESAERTLVKVDPSLGDLGQFGGMSGSPAFRFTQDGEYDLVGFLNETHEGLNAQVRAVHADFIREDGNLDYGLLPY
jgi:hypothetical protein